MMSEDQKSLKLQQEQTPAQQAAPHSPADVAAAFFKLNSGKLKNILSKLSMNQMRRVIWEATCFPLIPGSQSKKEDIEKQALHVINEMLMNKAVMQLEIELQRIQAKGLANEKRSDDVSEKEVGSSGTGTEEIQT